MRVKLTVKTGAKGLGEGGGSGGGGGGELYIRYM